MRYVLTIFLFFHGWICAVQNDYDVAVVGTSPISMLEAIYHISKNEKVLILEADERCGGSWKSIDICGISNVDLGCHLVGADCQLKDFFERYFDCKFVCLQHPDQNASDSHLRCTNGYYFSGGCFELVSKLQSVIESHSNATLLHEKLESIFVDAERGSVDLFLQDCQCTASKLIISPCSQFQVRNPSFPNKESRGHLYHHLYLLIEDEIAAQFTYLNGIVSGMSRAMNLTHFLHFPRENLQLIVIQLHDKNELNLPEKFFNALLEKNYLSPNAKILCSDTHSYYQCYMNAITVSKLSEQLIEVLDTSSFNGMIKYLDKWKSAMVPLQFSN